MTPVTDSRSQLLQVLMSTQLFFLFTQMEWAAFGIDKKKGKAHVEGKWEDKLKEILVCRY